MEDFARWLSLVGASTDGPEGWSSWVYWLIWGRHWRWKKWLRICGMILFSYFFFAFSFFYLSLSYDFFLICTFSFNPVLWCLIIALTPNPSVSVSSICSSLSFFFSSSSLHLIFLYLPLGYQGLMARGREGRWGRYLCVLTAVLWRQSYYLVLFSLVSFRFINFCADFFSFV